MSKKQPHHLRGKSRLFANRGDQSFDDRAVHLQKNIYGSDKGKLRLMILQRDLLPLIDNQRPLTVLDAGCGEGMMSEWVASFGHRVIACDSAAVMVEAATTRLQDKPNATVLHSSIQALPKKIHTLSQVSDDRFDFILCHAVLEWIEDQDALLHQLSRLLNPGGHLSLMFYNAWAREMAQLVYGNFDYIDRNYAVRQRVKLSPHWPAFPDHVERQLGECGFSVTQRSGIRIFYDIMRDRRHAQTATDDIIRHELRISQSHPYWQMGRYVHFLSVLNKK